MAIRGKKGYYFTLTVLILLAVVGVYLKSFADPGYSRSAEVDTQRITQVNRFVDAVNVDASSAVYVASYRAFLTLDQEKLRKTGYINKAVFNDTLEELVINGSISGTSMKLMDSSSLNEWELKMSDMAQRMRLSFDLELESATVRASQSSAWFVDVKLSTWVHITDDQTDSTWYYPLVTTAHIPITEFFDPVYTVGTQNKYYQKITRNSTVIFPLYSLHPLNLTRHIGNHSYIESNRSPSFLGRMWGDDNIGPSEYDHTGIESLVNVDDLQGVDLFYPGKSIVDWHYLDTSASPRSLCNATSPTWLRIDEDHAARYNVSC